MKKLFTMVLLLSALLSRSQVKIGDNPGTINTNSLLEMESTNKGFLPPRVALNSTSSVSPLTGTVPEGMLVYSIGGTLTNGYYFWNGTKWLSIIPSSTGTMGNQPYGSVSSSVDQSVSSVTTSALITYETNEILNFITHSTTVNPSRIIIQTSGTYLIAFSAELSGGTADIDIWLRQNGADIARSSSRVHLNTTDYRILTVTFIVTAVANDYFQLLQSSTNTSTGIRVIAAQTSPVVPVTPSIIVTINKISD